MNDDIEPIFSGWLENLFFHFEKKRGRIIGKFVLVDTRTDSINAPGCGSVVDGVGIPG